MRLTDQHINFIVNNLGLPREQIITNYRLDRSEDVTTQTEESTAAAQNATTYSATHSGSCVAFRFTSAREAVGFFVRVGQEAPRDTQAELLREDVTLRLPTPDLIDVVFPNMTYQG